MRSFKIDLEYCQNCGARLKLRALVMTSTGIERYLRWLGESVDPPTLAPARDPPYFKSQVIPEAARRACPGGAVRRALTWQSTGRRASEMSAAAVAEHEIRYVQP